MRKISAIEPSLTTMVFISLSKSVSRGLTTGGTIVAGPSARSAALLEQVRETSVMLDTHARPDQLYFLARNHAGVEERCGNAYVVARTVGDALIAAVKEECNGFDMALNFVTPEHAAAGFTSSTYSFNLPPYPSGSDEDNAALAQNFTTLLEANAEFKPCVSFGQDNGLVYATGAILCCVYCIVLCCVTPMMYCVVTCCDVMCCDVLCSQCLPPAHRAPSSKRTRPSKP